MKRPAVAAEKDNTKKASSRIEAAVKALTAAVLEDLPVDVEFGFRGTVK